MDKIEYKELNTPLVTDMLNMMQMVYGSKDIRGKFDRVVVNDNIKHSAPLFSALTAFIITTAIAMRMPGQERIPAHPTEEEILEKTKTAFQAIEVFFVDPSLKKDLQNCVDTYITNGKFGIIPGGEA
tara:strand:+ start:22 stop:402 length:381 start_codon:yes stop_codon:yes gene_type:complete